MVKSNIQSAENSYPIMPLAYDYHIPFISHKYSPFTLWIPLVVSSVAGKSPTHGCGRLRSPPWRLPNWPHPMAFRRKNNRWSDFMVKKCHWISDLCLIYGWFNIWFIDFIADSIPKKSGASFSELMDSHEKNHTEISTKSLKLGPRTSARPGMTVFRACASHGLGYPPMTTRNLQWLFVSTGLLYIYNDVYI